MKKLTTGILTVLLGLVAVDANAAITSKAYVDDKIKDVNTSITQITTNLGDNITNQIKSELENEESDISKALAEKADASDLTDLTTRVSTAEGEIDTLQEDVEGLKALTGDADKEGSVANQIAEAVKDFATKEEVQKVETDYKAADKDILDKLGDVEEGKTVVQMITTAVAEGVYDDTEVKAGIAANKTAVEKAQEDATKALADAEKAQETADKAIPKPSPDCENPANKCVLTYNNSVYAWEVIERGVGEVAGSGDAE